MSQSMDPLLLKIFSSSVSEFLGRELKWEACNEVANDRRLRRRWKAARENERPRGFRINGNDDDGEGTRRGTEHDRTPRQPPPWPPAATAASVADQTARLRLSEICSSMHSERASERAGGRVGRLVVERACEHRRNRK